MMIPIKAWKWIVGALTVITVIRTIYTMKSVQFVGHTGEPVTIMINSTLSPRFDNSENNTHGPTEEQHRRIFVFAKRREHLMDGCSGGAGTRRNSMLSTNLPRVIVDTEHKLTICLVPKVATSTTKTMLLQASSHPNASLVDQTRYDQLSDVGLKSVNELDEDEAVRALASREFTRIITVRHPIDRLMSAYRDKMLKNAEYVTLRNFILKHFPDTSNNSAEHPTFEQFVRFLTVPIAQLADVNQNHINNEHWAPQSNICLPCLLSYDYILKFETLQEDSEVILRRLYPEGEESLPIVNSSPKSNATAGPEPWLNLSPRLKGLVIRKYRADIKLFGYCESDIYGSLC